MCYHIPKASMYIAGMAAVLSVILFIVLEIAATERALCFDSGLQYSLVLILFPPVSTAQIGTKQSSLTSCILNKDYTALLAVCGIGFLPCGLTWLDPHSLANRFHCVSRKPNNVRNLGVTLSFKP